MPLVNFDDQYPIHRKVAGLSHVAFRLHTEAICWCARNETDGFIATEDLVLVSPQIRNPERVVPECMRRRVWHEARDECPSLDCPAPVDSDGWVVHDYWQLQASREESRAEKVSRSDRGSLGNHRRWHTAKGVTKPGCPYCPVAAPSQEDRNGIAVAIAGAIDGGSQSGIPRESSRADLSLSLSGSRSDLSPAGAIAPIAAAITLPPDDDDPIFKTIIDAVHERTGRVISADHARAIAAGILAGRRTSRPAAYARKAILAEPHPAERFLPPAAQNGQPITTAASVTCEEHRITYPAGAVCRSCAGDRKGVS